MSVATVGGRHARMLQILGKLQSSGGLNADQLAVELDVCRRTIFRDLNLMRQAGVEIRYDERLDCYRLAASPCLLATPTLDPQEWTTLLAAAHLSVLRKADDCARLLRRSVGKLLMHAPQQVQYDVLRVVQACRLHTAADAPAPTLLSVTHLVLTALAQRRMLRVTIQDPGPGTEVETRLAPYQLIAASDSWQVVGRSSRHCDVLRFDPCHFKDPQLTDDVYAIPRRFQAGSDSSSPLNNE